MIDDIPILNWFEEPIKKSVESVFDGLNDFVESLDLLKKYRSIHFAQLNSSVRTIKILGMQSPIDLAKLYYPAQVSTDIRRRIYRPEWTEFQSPAKTGPVKITKTVEYGAKFVETNPRVVILGGPGAGKTTFLKHLALAYTDVAIFRKTSLKRSFLPAYLHLPTIPKENIDVIAILAAQVQKLTDSRSYLFFQRLAETGNLVVLFDSLDEVSTDNRKTVVAAINGFANQFPKCRIVVSCRTADYEEVFDGFAEAEISRLTKEAVGSIVRAWFSQDQGRGERLLAMLENDSAVASLTETPLLLSLLCIQYRNDLALPKRKTELYRRCVDALLRDWDASRNFRRDSEYSQLSDDRKEMIFEYIAGSNSRDSLQLEFETPKLLGIISELIERFGLSANDALGILTEMESHHGIVEKCSAETYQFSHGTMHEYFAARHFVDTRQELKILKRHFEDDRWHTIITFMCAIINDPSSMLEHLIDQSSTQNFKNYPTFGKRLAHLLLLYRCMTMGVTISRELGLRICEHLIDSQIHMMTRLREDKIVPYAAKQPHGVRQLLVLYGGARPRASIEKVQLPYRSLMNEIYLSPLPDYVDKVLEATTSIWDRPDVDIYARIGMTTCLLAPIADVRPQEFINLMFKSSGELLKLRNESIRLIILESISAHERRFPEIKGALI